MALVLKKSRKHIGVFIKKKVGHQYIIFCIICRNRGGLS